MGAGARMGPSEEELEEELSLEGEEEEDFFIFREGSRNGVGITFA